MMLQYLMPEEIELYSARLDVLRARISAIRSRSRLPGTRHAQPCAGRLRRIDARCRSLKRLLLRLERSDAVLHARLQAAVERLQRSLGELAPASAVRGSPPCERDAIGIDTVEPNRLIVKPLRPTGLEETIQITR